MLITGTFFGTEEEYRATKFEEILGRNSDISVSIIDKWIGLVGHWAETEALALIGGIVSHKDRV